MGRYITWDMVANRYSKFATVTGAQKNDSEYIYYAENYVDMALGTKFSVPFSSNNDAVRDLAIDVAFAKTLMFDDQEKADRIMTHVNSVIGGLLEGSLIMLTDSAYIVDFNGEPVYSKSMDYVPKFGHGDVIEFHADSQQLYDEELERGY